MDNWWRKGSKSGIKSMCFGRLVGEEDETVTNDPGVDEASRF
jgi:hypothetical protein